MATIAKMKKRPLYEVDDLASVNAPRKYVRLYGVVTEVSGMTDADKYFEGILADDKASVRIVGFNIHHQQLASLMESKQPVELCNCTIQKQLHGEEMEIVIGSSSDISSSPRKHWHRNQGGWGAVAPLV